MARRANVGTNKQKTARAKAKPARRARAKRSLFARLKFW